MRGAYPTLAVLMVKFSSQSGFSGNYRPDLQFALAIIIMIPILILFPLAQRYLISGLASGALKG